MRAEGGDGAGESGRDAEGKVCFGQRQENKLTWMGWGFKVGADGLKRHENP